MADTLITFDKKINSTFMNQVREILPAGGNFNLCLTCGACASGCPASGLADMDPRKFVRLVALSQDGSIADHPWVWMCSLCMRCNYVCPMQINIGGLIYEARKLCAREQRPKGILSSCDMALRNASTNATGTPPEEFRFVVEDVLAEVHDTQPGWQDLQAPIDKQGAHFFSARIPVNRWPCPMR